MLDKTYELVCRLSSDTALERIKTLLSKEWVKYRADNHSITSIKTPLVLAGFDPRGYSHANWVGVNPFGYVSGVEVRCEPGDNGLTKVIVRIDRCRAFVLAASSVALGALVASALPPLGGAIFIIAFSCAAWFGTVSFLGGSLIKREIADHLNEAPRQRRWYVLE
ncbi:MAG TPA: hypothetical protein VKW06_05590 [Candidatus Angelobacter sp.]|nr:hypothetical protein [Candidatus Angelobacter sp.]